MNRQLLVTGKSGCDFLQQVRLFVLLLSQFLFAIATAGCARERPAEAEILPAVREIKTGDELKAALLSHHAVIHVDVDWSLDAIAARKVVSAFHELAVDDPALERVAYFRLDMTDPSAELQQVARVWLKSESGYRSIGHGTDRSSGFATGKKWPRWHAARKRHQPAL